MSNFENCAKKELIISFSHNVLYQFVFLTLTVTVPECLYRSPIRADSRDDLPQPTLPTKAVSEPGFTLIFISFNTGFLSLRCENVPPDISNAYSEN